MGLFNRQRAQTHAPPADDGAAPDRTRDAVKQRITPLIDTARRGALLVLDIDRRSFIDLGYASASELLEVLERSCRSACRQGDQFIRFGESCFVVVVFDATSPRHVTAVAERLRACWRQGLSVGEHQVLLDIAVGVSFFPQDSVRADELLWMAENAALTAHRDRSTALLFYTPELDRASLGENELAADLAKALDGDELYVEYQPKVHVTTGRVVGVEALVRWAHPTRGRVPPALFVPIAEENGLITQLTDKVIRVIGDEADNWPLGEAGDFRIAVNISAVELHLPGRAEALLELIEEVGLEPDELEFELTETALVRDRVACQTMVTVLAEAGVRIAIDDFGTGYTSFSYLSDFPIEVIKIDRKFVQAFAASQGAAEMLHAMVSLGQILKLAVIAEGAETPTQVRQLVAAGVDYIQGYAYARPGPADTCPLRFEPLGIIERSPEAPPVEAPPALALAPEPEPDLPEGGLPLTPVVLAALFQLDPEAPDTPEQLEALAEADPPLALRLLQLVADRTSGGRSHLLSISEALTRIGSRAILDTLTRPPIATVFLPPPTVARRLWLHSIQVAHWAEAVAWQTRSRLRPKHAYIAGLLHDIGRFAELKVHPEARLSIERGDWQQVEEMMMLEQQLLGMDHATLGALACERWGLPESLRYTIANHHKKSGRWPSASEDVTTLSQVVQVADHISLVMLQRPELGKASTAARIDALRRVVHSKLGADLQALAQNWQSIDERSKRACQRVGLRV